MNYELLFSLGAAGIALLLGFLANRAVTYKRAAVYAVELANRTADIMLAKEEYTRELEKTVLGTLPPGKLAARLNELFKGVPGRGTSTVPIAVRPAGPTKP